jgi:hypothetical protein
MLAGKPAPPELSMIKGHFRNSPVSDILSNTPYILSLSKMKWD